MSPQKINRISVGLLLLGLGSALAIFLTAAPVMKDPLLDDSLGNKRYLFDLEKIGGKGNVMASEFLDWFGGIWHGEALAGTVSVLTVGATLTFRFIAARPGFINVLLARDDLNETPPEK